MGRTALITGVTGQDGSYLTQFLLEKGYSVIGLTRDNGLQNLKNLQFLNIENKILIKECDLTDLSAIINILEKYAPDEIYNLASQSSVRLSFFDPAGTIQFNTLSTLNILEAIKDILPNAKFYQASSSEMYGNAFYLPIKEESPQHPASPYAISKASAHSTTINYRESYGLYACCGILFNHISVLASSNFFVKKVISSAINIKNGLQNELKVGNLNVKRDFGFAPDYVKVMWQILQQENPQDFIIASGKSICLKDLVDYVFDKLNLDKNKIVVDKNLFRPNDIQDIYGDNTKAKEILGWEYNRTIYEVLDIIIEEEIRNEQKNKCTV